MRKTMFMLVLAFVSFSSLSFAASTLDWQPLALTAVMASLSALAIMYAIGHAFDINQLKFLAKEELVQVVGTGLLIAGFASFQLYLENISADLGGGMTIVDLAKQNLASINNELSNTNNVLANFAKHIGKESSRSVYCSFSAIGFNLASCGSFSTLGGPLPLAFSALATGIGEIATLRTILDFGAGTSSLVFTLFFPLGLFLRTFKLTRGAGGLLIAIAITFYLILPYSIVFVNQTIESTRNNIETKYGILGNLGQLSASYESCNEDDFGTGNEERAIRMFRNFMFSNGNASFIQSLIYLVLIKSTILLAVVISIMIASIRAFGAICGAEIDVSPLARLL